MAVNSDDFKTFFKMAYNITQITNDSTSKLKCLKCGKQLRENSTKSGLECTSNNVLHSISYLSYMSDYSDIFKAYFDDKENDTLTEEIILPNDAIYVELIAVYVNNEIIKA